MAERSKCDLPYGHYGRVRFNLDDSNLDFGRRLTLPSPIKVFDSPAGHTTLSNTRISNNAIGKAQPDGKRHEKQTQALVQQNPECQPALNILASFIRTSEAVQKAAVRHEPAKGNLLCFVKVWSEIRHRSISVAAHVAGETGSDLRLVQMHRQRRGWAEDRSSWLEMPTLHGEEAQWSSDGDPILQVHTAPYVETHDCLIAVRLLTKTHILRPSHRKVPLENALSNLALNHVCTVTSSDMEGRTHADVTFNPWFVQQLAFVDPEGMWTVLEFQSRNFARIPRSWHGSIEESNSVDSFKLNDGWARISWIVNLTTLVVCTRQSLALVALRPDGTASTTSLGPDILGAAGCIFDMVILPESRDTFAVLTRTHVVLCITVDNGSGSTHTTVISKIRHFKSSEDLTLRLKSWTDQGDTFLALFSNLRSPVCVYRLRQDTKDQIACDSPFELVLPTAQALRDVHMQPLTMLTKQGASDEQSKAARTTQFYSMTALQADYSVVDKIYYHKTAGRSLTQDIIVPPLWRQKLPVATQSRLRREDFVVMDDDLDAEHALPRAEPVPRRARKQRSHVSVGNKRVALEIVSDALSQESGESKDVQELAVEVAAVLRSNDHISEPIRTLDSLSRSEIVVGDIHEASVQLQGAFQAVRQDVDTDPDDHDYRLQYRLDKMRLPVDLEDSLTSPDANLASVYDQIISIWVSSLPATVPGWVRLAKMNLAQRIAAETFLASHTLRLEEVKAHATHHGSDDQQESERTWELPVRTSDPVSQAHPSSSSVTRHISQHSTLPTPSPTATPSVITASTNPFISAAPELHRLSKYTVFQRPAPMVLPRPLVKVLSHWELGKDPEDYDWLAFSRHLNQQEDEEAEHELTEKERKRMQRRAERHILRQRKEAAASQASQLTSSQATEIASASQPTFKVESQPPGIPASSQSQGPSTGALAASQVVPGRFGGRPPPKKRRKQGF